MKLSYLVASALAVTLTACSTYRTNSDIKFDSVHISQKPVVPVGNNVPSDMVTYLGWVNAEVSSPSYFHSAPTEQQVDIVLAQKAQEIGADAVIHVEYKSRVSSATLSKLSGRGQAVRINAWHVGEADPAIVMSENVLQKDNRASELDLLINPVPIAPIPQAQDISIKPLGERLALDQPAMPSATAINTAIIASVTTASAAEVVAATPGEIASLNNMLSDARILKAYAKEQRNKTMYKTAKRLEDNLENHLLEFTGSFAD